MDTVEVGGWPDDPEPLRYNGTVVVGGRVTGSNSLRGVTVHSPVWSHWVTDALPEGTEVVLVAVGRSPYWSLVDDG